MLVEQHDQRDRLRPEMRARRTQRIGGLQGMTPLHAPATRDTVADMDIKAAHVRGHDRQVFLHLRRDARFLDRPATVRARCRQRDIDRLVTRGRRLSMGVPAVVATGATARRLRPRRGGPLRERGRLALPGASGRLQCVRQSLELAAQPIALTLQPRILFPQALGIPFDAVAVSLQLIALPTQPLHLTLEVLRRRELRSHRLLMPDSPLQYKRNPLTNYPQRSE